MRIAFGHFKYVFKNIWFVLPFAILPAVFLALSLSYGEIGELVRAFFSGNPRLGFLEYFKALSILRFDSVLGGIYDILAFACTVFCTAFMLTFVEKHMRIGKRTMSGVFSGFWRILFSSFAVTLLYLALYEIWAVVLAAMFFLIASVTATGLVYVLFVLAVLVLTFALLYVSTVFYLWLPCRQATGFGPYDAFVYSYRLMMGVRWRLVLSFAVSFVAAFVVLGGIAVLHEAVFRIVGAVLFALLFLSFTIRMETVYFATDKLDREDELQSYNRGY